MTRPHLITLRFSLLLAALFCTAPAAAAQLTLAWTDNSNNEAGFRIERRISGGSFAQIAVVAANVTSFIDSTVTVGSTYCYRVRAYNQAGASAYTGEVCRAAGTIDNGRAGTSFTGTWSVSSGPNPYGSTALYATGSGQDTYRWTPTIATTRLYEVYAWWTSLPSRSTAVEYRIRHAGGTAVARRDQRTGGGQWQYLGIFQFNAGTGGYVQVSDVNGSTVCADAVRFVPR